MAASKPVQIQAIQANAFSKHEIFAKLISAGTAACVAEAITLPMDCAKIKLQVQIVFSSKVSYFTVSLLEFIHHPLRWKEVRSSAL